MRLFIQFFIVLSFLFPSNVQASDYASRQAQHIVELKDLDYRNSLILQAFENQTLNQVQFDSLLLIMSISSVADFHLVQFVRILFFTDGEYDSQILPEINKLRFWMEEGEDWLVHYTENHMCMWMSSEYLLNQKYGKPMTPDLLKRLKHFLELKINYGFYEFFSSTYLTYTLSGLLNLVDFCEDVEIKELATLAAQRLLKEILMATNDIGVFNPAAGRNYKEKYFVAYNQNHNALIYLVLGIGQKPLKPTHSGSFLATSTLDVQSIVDDYTQNLDIKYVFGHSIQESRTINQHLSRLDRAIFNWSFGGYFHPYVSNMTQWLMNKYDIWNHKEFELFSVFKGLPQQLGNFLAKVGGALSKSSVLSGQTVAIYKNKSVVLTSILDKWKGYMGYQLWPYCATVDTIAVFTATGDVNKAWEDWNSTASNTHLPYVWQESNVALVMYRPDPLPALFGFNDREVVLFFPEDQFDEVRHNGLWIIARKNTSYIAVRRYSDEYMNNQYLCTNEDGQTWIVVVGNIETHGSFNDFEEVIADAVFYDNWYNKNNQWIYHASIQVDGKFIEYRWKGPFKPVNPVTKKEVAATNKISHTLFPNPATKNTVLKVNTNVRSKVEVQILNTFGQMVYYQEFEESDNVMQNLNISHLSRGLYHVVVTSGNETQSSSLKVE